MSSSQDSRNFPFRPHYRRCRKLAFGARWKSRVGPKETKGPHRRPFDTVTLLPFSPFLQAGQPFLQRALESTVGWLVVAAFLEALGHQPLT